MTALLALAGVVTGHMGASLVQTFLHRALGHSTLGGWISAQHVGEHHSIYSGGQLELPRYRDDEKSLSIFYVLPAILMVGAGFLEFPFAFAAGFAAGLCFSYLAHIYLHAQYHLTHAHFENHRWFRRLRELHMVHHLHQDRNFAVLDLYWDKLMGTYADANARMGSIDGKSGDIA